MPSHSLSIWLYDSVMTWLTFANSWAIVRRKKMERKEKPAMAALLKHEVKRKRAFVNALVDGTIDMHV